MDESIRRVIDAVRSIFNEKCSNEERRQASNMIELLKEEPASFVGSIAANLVTLNLPYVQHVGWNLFEHIIKYKWLDLNADERLSIRNNCFLNINFARNHTSSLNAASRCISFMIYHEWPQNWPELFEQLELIGTEINGRITFLILLRLIEDVITVGNIENYSRRRELNSGLNLNMPKILSLSKNALLYCLANPNGETNSIAYSVLCLLAEVACSIECDKLEYFIEMLGEICKFLDASDYIVREQAAKCLWRLAMRRHSSHDKAIVVTALFNVLPMDAILIYVENCPADDTLYYNFIKVLSDVLIAVGQTFATLDTSKLENSKGIENDKNFIKYLAIIRAFLFHPSLYLRYESASIIQSFLNCDGLLNNEYFKELLASYLGALPILAQKIGLPSENDLPWCKFSREDFDNDEEFDLYFNLYLSRISNILQKLLNDDRIEILFEKLILWIRSNFIDAKVEVSMKEWISTIRIIHIIFSGSHIRHMIKESDSKDNRLVKIFDQILEAISSSKSMFELNRFLSILKALLFIFEIAPDRVTPLLGQVLRIHNDFADCSNEANRVRKLSVEILLKLTRNYSTCVINRANEILEACLELRKIATLAQVSQIYQVVITLANFCTSFDMQEFFLSKILDEMITYFRSSDVLCACQGDADFLNYIGLTVQAPPYDITDVNDSFPQIAGLVQLRVNFEIFIGVLNLVQSVDPSRHPAFTTIVSIIPVIFYFLSRVRSVFKEENLNLIHPSYGRSVFSISNAERIQLLAFADFDSASTRNNNSGEERHKNRIVDLFMSIESTVGLLVVKMTNELFREPEIFYWSMSLVDEISILPNYHIRLWIRKIWKPFFCSSPNSSYPYVKDMLIIVLKELIERLCLQWDKMACLEQIQDPSEDQILQMNVLYILTRDTTMLLKELFCLSGEVIKESHFVKQLIVSDMELLELFANISFNILAFRDTVSVIRVLPTCRHIVDALVGKDVSHLVRTMFIKSVQCLQVHGCDEFVAGNAPTLIFSLFYSFRDEQQSLLRLIEEFGACDQKAILNFQNTISSLYEGGNITEKLKRKAVKELLQPIIEKAVSEQHKRPVMFRKLPAIRKKEKMKKDEAEADDFIGFLSLFD